MSRPSTPTGDSKAAWVLAAAVALTAVIAAPVLIDPGARLFGSDLLGFHPDAYIVIEQMESSARLTHVTQPATDWLGVLMARLVGGVPAYNFLILLTFPLAAWFTFLLARALGLGTAPSVFAALIYAFSPFHLAHASYHPHISQIQWLPLYLLAVWACLDRWTPLRGLLLAGAAGLLVLSNFYAGLIGAVITPVAVPVLFAARHGGNLRRNARNLVGTVGTLAACATLGALYAWSVGAEVLFGSGRFSFPYQDLFRYCARWWSYLIPAIDHPLFGDWAATVWERHGIGPGLLEQQVFIGWSILALAGVAVAGYIGGRRHPSAPGLVPALLAIAVVAFLFSLPPEGRMSTLTRPTAFLYSWLPMFRAYARFGVVVQLSLTLLAGIGLSTLLDSGRSRGRIAAAVLVLAAALELAPVPPWRWHWLLPTEAHRWVEQQSESMTILDCHSPRPGESWRLERMQQRVRLPEGMRSDCAEPAISDKLAAFGYTHMIVRSEFRLSEHIPADGFETIETFPDSTVLRISAEPAPVFIAALGGFSWREIEGHETFRWMGERGDLSVVNASHADIRARLNVRLEAFPESRNVTVLLDGQPLDRLVVPIEPTRVELAPFELTPGRHVLTFQADEPATTPDEVLRNGDRRRITVALWDWQFEVGS